MATIRSVVAEYLTYIAATGAQKSRIKMRYADENIWLTQKMMAMLYDVEVPTINAHMKKIVEYSELTEDAMIRKYLIVQQEGEHQVSRQANHY